MLDCKGLVIGLCGIGGDVPNMIVWCESELGQDKADGAERKDDRHFRHGVPILQL